MSRRITVRVTPRSGRERVETGPDGGLIVRVSAPPEGGKANAAVCATVAKALGVPKSSVRVVRGESARVKVLEIEGGEERITDALGRLERGGEGS